MPHFDRHGREEWVCQYGDGHVCTGPSNWVKGRGNMCDEHLLEYRAQKARTEALRYGCSSEQADEVAEFAEGEE